MTLLLKAELAFNALGIMLALAFVVTCGSCYHDYRKPDLGSFIDQKIEQYDAEKPRPVVLWKEVSKPTLTFRQRQASALADVYGLTASDVAPKVNIWGKHYAAR
jgi:hypothetical protein